MSRSGVKLRLVECGLQFKPPTLFMLYSDLDSGKTRMRSMPLREFDSDTDVSVYATDLLRSPKHSKFLGIIPEEQLSSLLRRVKDAHHSKSTPPPMSSPTHKPSTYHDDDHHHRQSSLLDIPSISSPSARKNKPFDCELDKLLNFDNKQENAKDKASLESDSLEVLLESVSYGGDGRQKLESSSKKLLSSIENGVQGSTKLSDLPGLSGMGPSPQDDDQLLVVLRGSFDVPLLDSGRHVGFGKPPPVSSVPTQTKISAGKQPSEHIPGNMPNQPIDTFASEVPDYSNEFYSELSSHHYKEEGDGHNLEDKSLAISELLDDGDDDSLGLGLGLGGADIKLSGSFSGDELKKRLDNIVTPPPLSDDDAPMDSRHAKAALSHDLLLFSHNNEDLNKVSDEYLTKKKEEMNLMFETNCLKPGDEGYIYDKEVDFDNEPKMESGWDSDNSMSDF